MPECTAWSEHRDLDHAVDQPAQRRGQARDADRPVRRVGDDDDVGREQVAVRVQERGERRRADLLLALDEHRDADAEVVAEHPQRADVRDDARLVVRRAAAVQPPVALGRLERRACPSPRRPPAAGRRGGRRAARSARPRGAGRRATTAGRAARHARAPGRRRGPRRAAAPTTASALARDVRLVELGVGHARDAHEGLEVGAQRGERGGRARAQGRPCGRRGRMVWCEEASVTDKHATRLPWRGVRTQQRPPARDSRTDGERAAADGRGQGPPDAEAQGRRGANKRPLVATDRQEGQPAQQAKAQRDVEYRGDADRRRAQHARQGPRPRAPLHPRLRRRPLEPRRVLPADGRRLPRVIQFALAKTAARRHRHPRAVRLHPRGDHRRLADVARPEEAPRREVRGRARSRAGSAMYAVLRAFQIRPARLPKPQVKHGQRPS